MTFYYNPKTKQLEQITTSIEAATALGRIVFLNPIDRFFINLAVGLAAGMAQFFKPGALEDDDAKNIATIIQAGKESGAEEMEIELDREVMQGLNLKALEDEVGVNILVGQQGKSRYRIKVKYKS